MPRLIITTSGEEHERVVSLRGPVRIGRHPSQDVQVLDRMVSKSHARVEAGDGGWYLTDLESRNGTFLNHRLIAEPTLLKHGDQILLGASVLRFEDEARTTDTAQHVRIESTEEMPVSLHREFDSDPRASGEFLPEELVANESDLRGDYERLRMAYVLTQDLALEVDLERLLDKILDRLLQWLRADRGVILLNEAEDGEVRLVPRRFRTASGRAGNTDTTSVRLSETILQIVSERRAAVLSADAQSDSRFGASSSIIMQGIRSTMTVPMVHGDRLVGVLHVDTLISANAFAEKDVRVLQVFASQATLAIRNAELIARARGEARTRQRFERLLSPNLVEKIVGGELDIVQGGHSLDVTVLFADIRGFTRIAEQTDAEDVVEMLNEFFEIMVQVVFDYDGTLDKFLGDGFMAFWGAPVSQSNHTWRAIAAGLRMQKAMRSFNAIRSSRGLPPIYAGIGIDTGSNVVGYMGSSKTMGYSVIGEGVNRASRLCSAALKNEVLVSERAYERTRNAFEWQARPPQALRGFSRPERSFRAIAARTGGDAGRPGPGLGPRRN